MSKPISINETVTFTPTTNTRTTNMSASSRYPASNGYDSYTSTNYARFSITTNSTGYTYYVFNVTGIPSIATITNVTCTAKLYVNNTSSVTNTNIQLYSDTTAKGESKTFASTSATTVTMDGGTWTVDELANARVRFGGTASSGNQNNKYIYFYGATLSVTYSVTGTEYTITAASSVTGVTASPSTQDIMAGESATVIIDGVTDLNDIKVEDNDVDVTNQLEEHTISGGTIERYPASYTTSGSISGTRYQSTIGCSVENPSSQSGSDYSSGSGPSANIDYAFDFSDIPEGAIIKSVSVVVRGHLESTSNSSERAELQLYSGNTSKGSMSKFTSTSNQNITMTPGTWTREELQDAKLRFTIGYYGGLVVGVTWTVTYSVTISHYYTYTLSNLNNDHVILIEEAGAFIPPEEDPEYTYYPVTISSINATTNPGTGTTRVVEGTNQTITIYPDDPLVTLILDNGTDVSSQLVTHAGTSPTYTVTTVSGAGYGFNLNSSTGYYVSANTGINKSTALSRVNFDLPVRCLVTLSFINNAEETYDFGVFSKVDTALSTTYWQSSQYSGDTTTDAGLEQLRCNTSTYNTTTAQTLTYEIPAGEHFIDIKFSKDDQSASGNDSLQWKIDSIQELEPNNYYTYTLSNIQQKHSLIFVFGDVQYYYITSSGTDCKLYPDGQFVELEGDNYKLTIVPNNTNDVITVRDNNIDVSNSLEMKTSTIEKDGRTITYKSYNYTLTNISAAHNIVVSTTSGSTVYYKVNGSWVSVSKVYKKIDDRWQEQTNFDNLFDTNTIYIKV